MSDREHLFQKYYNRLAAEGVIKALIWGLAVGFAIFFVTAFISWATDFIAGLWIGIGIGIAAIALTTVLLYFFLFRPNTMDIARRLDRLGLEERMITMAEFRKDATYIAMCQREDAQRQLQSVEPKNINYKVSAVSIVLAGIFGAATVAISILFALSIFHVLPSGNEILTPVAPKEFVLVSYAESDGGYIDGESDQMVEVGSDSQPVMAVPDEGYMFVQWSDGVEGDVRQDLNVQETIFVFPEFQPIGGDEDGDPGDEPGDQPPSDQPEDLPQDGEDENDNNSSSDPGEGNEEEGVPPPSGDSNEGAGTQGGNSNNSVDPGDGQVNYSEIYGEWYEKAMEAIASGEFDGDIGDFLQAYLDSLLN